MTIKSAEKFQSNLVRKLWWTLIPSSLTATLANVLFYVFVMQVLGFQLLVPNDPPVPVTVPLQVFDVVFMSLLWAVAAGIVFLTVIAFSRNPIPIYMTISGIVLLLSFALPLMMPSDKVIAETKVSLISMHIIGAVVVVGILVMLYRRHISVK